MQLTLIESPRYTVDFNEYQPYQPTHVPFSVKDRIIKVAHDAFEAIKMVFSALKASAITNVKYLKVSFQHIVIGYDARGKILKLPANLYLVVLRLVVWVFGVSWNFLSTAYRIYNETRKENQYQLLKQYVGDEINPSHLISQNVKLDASGVPEDVKIDDLLTILDQVDFHNQNSPYYMSPRSGQEGNRTFTKEELRRLLNKVISDTYQRVAFIGTPPAHDTPRLMAFYEQIETALRLSIHKSNEALESFKRSNGSDPNQYNPEQKRQFRFLFEDRARIAINMGIAGAHCGSRYMGEAMEIYYYYHETEQMSGTLQEALIEILSQKRMQIAKGEIAAIGETNTHNYNKYMSNIGPIVGLPATENIVEHLDSVIDIDNALTSFFKKYTVDTIIDTVQEKFRKSQLFREKVIDWMKDQKKDWNSDAYLARSNDLSRDIESIITTSQQNTEDENTVYRSYISFKNLVEYLHGKRTSFPSKELPWTEFLLELLALDESNDWLRREKRLNPLQAATLKNDLKTHLTADHLGSQLIQQLQTFACENQPIDERVLRQRANASKMKEQIRSILPLPHETIDRILSEQITIQEAVNHYLDQERSSQFIQQLRLETMYLTGLSKELLEWLLVSQKILLPQTS